MVSEAGPERTPWRGQGGSLLGPVPRGAWAEWRPRALERLPGCRRCGKTGPGRLPGPAVSVFAMWCVTGSGGRARQPTVGYPAAVSHPRGVPVRVLPFPRCPARGHVTSSRCLEPSCTGAAGGSCSDRLSLCRPQRRTSWLGLAWSPSASSSLFTTPSGSSYWYGVPLADIIPAAPCSGVSLAFVQAMM